MVTGTAAGIGKALCEQLAKQGVIIMSHIKSEVSSQ